MIFQGEIQTLGFMKTVFFFLFYNKILTVQRDKQICKQVNKKKEGPLKPKTGHVHWKEMGVKECLFFSQVQCICMFCANSIYWLLEGRAGNLYLLCEIIWHVERQICGNPHSATSEQQWIPCTQGSGRLVPPVQGTYRRFWVVWLQNV
jgi:hypothetical protein